MNNNSLNADERRQIILSGIRQDHSTTRIAAEMGVRDWTVLNDLRAMRHFHDTELKQAYIDKEKRTHVSTQLKIKQRNERFLNMTGMTFQEKNFENMINYYRSELKSVYTSDDEHSTITALSTNIRRILKRNGIITKVGSRIRLTDRTRKYLGLN